MAAQQSEGIVRGIVSDNMGPLMGATVTWENKDGRTIGGAATGLDGSFMLQVPKGETNLTLSFSFVGYVTQKKPYTGQARVDVTLTESKGIDIGVVTVTAQAVNVDSFGQDKTTIGYATETIDIEQFKEMAVVSVEDMLIGKVAGLDIIGDGDPGSISTIRIRGTSSLNANNQPLIVIDGVPQDITVDTDFDFSDATVENFGSLVNISPNDIQEIEVLKDAAATVLWGDKAANGVLNIKTKQGGNHTPYFSVSDKFALSMKPEKFNLLNGSQYKVLMQDAMYNYVKDGNYAPDRLNMLNNQKDILYDKAYNYFDEYNQNTDWLDLVTQVGYNNDFDFAMSGGGDKVKYRFSLAYGTFESTTVGSDYDRITSRLNVEYRFSSKFRVNSSFHYSESTKNAPYERKVNDEWEIEPVRSIALKKMPNMSPWVIDTEGNQTDEYFTAPNDQVLQSTMPNPLALVEESVNRLYARNIGAQFSTQYDLFRGFTATATVSFEMFTNKYNLFLPQSAVNATWSESQYNRGNESLNNNSKTYISLQTRYVVPIRNKNHTLTLTLGEQISAETANAYSLTTSGNAAREVSLPAAGGKVTGMSSGQNIYRNIGVYGSATYTLRGKYNLTASARVAANSDNALGSKWGNITPALNWRWNIEREPWMKTVEWVKTLNLKGSVGRTQRRQDMTKVTGTYSQSGWYGSESWVAIQPEQIQLYNLTPEIVSTYDISVGGELFKDGKLNFDIHYYQEQSKNLTQKDARIPSNTGFSTLRVYNSGMTQNRGFEASVGFKDILTFGGKNDSKNKVRISLQNVNVARNRNRMVELPDNMEPERYTLGNGNVARKAIAGTPVGSIYGFQFDGIYQDYPETFARDRYGNVITDINGKNVTMKIGGTWQQKAGDARYRDQNYDGNINEYDIIYLGNSYPSIIGGATLVLRWRDLMFRTSFAMRLGHDVYNKARLNSEQMSDANNQSTNALARWRYKGEITEIPRALWGTNRNSLVSDLYIEDASFFKIKDVTLSYNIPQDFVKNKLRLQRASIFFNAYNILTLTKYTGVDPEIPFSGAGSDAFVIGEDNSKTPSPRKFALGFSFDF